MNHFQRLMRLYEKAPIHNFYQGIKLLVDDKKAIISLPIDERYFHGGMAVHGSVYFKLLDDAAYFACQSQIYDYFIVTTNFNISLRRPIVSGTITATGEFECFDENIIRARATLTDENGKVCGTGIGEFMKSKTALEGLNDY
ncbi:MAG: PaaI family thioesterase [Bacteroidetes bacterium]|nr:PaaI family thioesterase [Bacteroidota bacterium]